MSIRVGLRPMRRGYDLGALKPGPFPPEPLEYVFTEGTVSPYNVMYDDIDGSGPYTITTSEGAQTSQNARKLVRTSDGTLYAVYFRLLAGNYQIYVKKSTDDGATWTDETKISTYAGMQSYGQIWSCIAVDSSDNLHVVWSGMATGFTTHNQIWYALYDGSWQTPVRISTYAGMDSNQQYRPSIAVDSGANVHVVWYGKATGYPTDLQIWYALYDGSWHTPIRISTYAGMDSDIQNIPSIAVDGSNHLHVVWHGMATGYTTNDQIWYALYDGSWHTPIRISTYANMATNTQASPCIAVDSSNHLHVVWYGMATGYTTWYQIWYALYDGSWQTPVRISTYAGMQNYHQYYPSIAVDGSDHLHVVWEGRATGYTDFDKVWYAEYTDAWVAPVCLQPTGRNQWPNLRWSRWP